jgi:hypothetical protein
MARLVAREEIDADRDFDQKRELPRGAGAALIQQHRLRLTPEQLRIGEVCPPMGWVPVGTIPRGPRAGRDRGPRRQADGAGDRTPLPV